MNPDIQAWIDEQKPELVKAAEEFVEESKICHPMPPPPSHGKKGASSTPTGRPGKPKARVSSSQLRNLLSVAQSERSLAVFRNFLRYQVGRKSKAWQDSEAGDLLEQTVEREVASRGKPGEEKVGVPAQSLAGELLPLLIGYVIREYTYRCRQLGTSTDA
jgi:hypothetical protein